MEEIGDKVQKRVKTQTQFRGYVNSEEYHKMYKDSIENNEAFWEKQGERIDWIKKYTKVKNCKFSSTDVSIQWYYDGTLNVSYNCIDRHIKNGKKDKIAVIWEGNDCTKSLHITYEQLLENVCKCANGLRKQGVQKGDRVTIYMSMIPEIIYTMLACARIGAIHSVIFGGYSPDSIAKRIDDCESEYIVTVDVSFRGAKSIPLKSNVDKALKICKQKVKKVVVVQDDPNYLLNLDSTYELLYSEMIKDQDKYCEPVEMQAEDPLFILYTSGSTGIPKGVLHTSGGYLVYASFTHQYVFDYRYGDIYWCTADCGWITGHSYLVYGPLCNGGTTLAFEGLPNYPDPSRCWQVVDKHQVNIFYTAPTAIRALMKEGDEFVKNTSRKSLKVLGTVGEPINPEAWDWYFNVVGDQRCPISDTWWQTETGGFMITPQPGAMTMKPGSATLPFYGIQPCLVDDNNQEINEPDTQGNLCINDSWPGQMRTVYKNHQRFIRTYFSKFEGRYFSGDGAKKDKDGYYWITGRVDDMKLYKILQIIQIQFHSFNLLKLHIIIVSGHNLGTAEIESSLVKHKDVAEAAVVGIEHEIKGYGIYCFVILMNGIQSSDQLKKDLVSQVRTIIGPIATPDYIQFSSGLPKTRSGKIMRRILKNIANNIFDQDKMGDISTLADPNIVQELIISRQQL